MAESALESPPAAPATRPSWIRPVEGRLKEPTQADVSSMPPAPKSLNLEGVPTSPAEKKAEWIHGFTRRFRGSRSETGTEPKKPEQREMEIMEKKGIPTEEEPPGIASVPEHKREIAKKVWHVLKAGGKNWIDNVNLFHKEGKDKAWVIGFTGGAALGAASNAFDAFGLGVPARIAVQYALTQAGYAGVQSYFAVKGFNIDRQTGRILEAGRQKGDLVAGSEEEKTVATALKKEDLEKKREIARQRWTHVIQGVAAGSTYTSLSGLAWHTVGKSVLDGISISMPNVHAPNVREWLGGRSAPSKVGEPRSPSSVAESPINLQDLAGQPSIPPVETTAPITIPNVSTPPNIDVITAGEANSIPPTSETIASAAKGSSFTPEVDPFAKLNEAAQTGGAQDALKDLTSKLQESESIKEHHYIRPGETVSHMLADSGMPLSYSALDAEILGAHIAANYDSLLQMSEKMAPYRPDGFVFPKFEEIHGLVEEAKAGNVAAQQRLMESVHWVQQGGTFEILSPDAVHKVSETLASLKESVVAVTTTQTVENAQAVANSAAGAPSANVADIVPDASATPNAGVPTSSAPLEATQTVTPPAPAVEAVASAGSIPSAETVNAESAVANNVTEFVPRYMREVVTQSGDTFSKIFQDNNYQFAGGTPQDLDVLEAHIIVNFDKLKGIGGFSSTADVHSAIESLRNFSVNQEAGNEALVVMDVLLKHEFPADQKIKLIDMNNIQNVLRLFQPQEVTGADQVGLKAA